MRKIEFRGKVREGEQKGEWAYGGILHYGNGAGEHSYIVVGSIFADLVEVDNNTVGQYTGLKDKNGVKIFEGDIVKRIVVHNHDSIVCIVEFLDGAFIMRQRTLIYSYETVKRINSAAQDDILEIEIIGNIHDNPELLEKEATE